MVLLTFSKRLWVRVRSSLCSSEAKAAIVKQATVKMIMVFIFSSEKVMGENVFTAARLSLLLPFALGYFWPGVLQRGPLPV